MSKTKELQKRQASGTSQVEDSEGKRLETLFDSRDDSELMTQVINDFEVSNEYIWSIGTIDRRQQLAHNIGKMLVCVCSSVGCEDSDEAFRETKKAIEWSHNAYDNDIWATVLLSNGAIDTNSFSQDERHLLDDTMKYVLAADALIVTCNPHVTEYESIAFQFGRSRMMPIFDVSSDPVRYWNYSEDCFSDFCSTQNMYRWIFSAMSVFRSKCLA